MKVKYPLKKRAVFHLKFGEATARGRKKGESQKKKKSRE